MNEFKNGLETYNFLHTLIPILNFEVRDGKIKHVNIDLNEQKENDFFLHGLFYFNQFASEINYTWNEFFDFYFCFCLTYQIRAIGLDQKQFWY